MEEWKQIKQALKQRAAQNVCPVCGERKPDVADRTLVRGYLPDEPEGSHLLSCGACYAELEKEVPHG